MMRDMLDTTLHGLLDRQAARAPASPFLIFEDRTFSFATFADATRRVAAALASLGVAKGDRVAIVMSNRPEFLLSWFALSRLGAVEVPLNTGHRGTILRYMLEQAECTMLIVEGEFSTECFEATRDLGKLRSVVILDGQWAGDATDFGDLLESAPLSASPNISAADPMAIIFTSGTTGPSKGVVLPQQYALHQAAMIVAACGYTEEDCLYNALPLFHGNAQFLSTIPALLAGARMVLARRFSASAFWGDVARHGCTEFNYIGGILPILLKAEPRADDATGSLRLMMGAGASKDVFEAVEARFGVELIEGYGMTETGIPMINHRGDRRAGSCGKIRGTHAVMLVDDDGDPVGPGVAGELLVRPLSFNGMMSGYYGMPDKTIEAWRDLWFHTGDYLACDAEGYFSFVDRKKDALRRRGENISSFEVERGVNRHPAVFESAAVAVASDVGEDEVMICLSLRPGFAAEPIDILRHCAADMAPFMVPRFVRILEALPRTPTERIQKFALRAAGVTADTYDREADPAWRRATGSAGR